MKILHVSGATAWGGNEQQLVDLIFGLEKINVDNLLFCFKDSPLVNYCKQHNLNFCDVPDTKAYSYKLAKSLKKCVEVYKPNVIHLHTSNSVTFYVLSDILFSLNVPAVFSKKGISSKKKGLSAFKYNYKNIRKVICVSEAVLNSFKLTLKPRNHHKLCVVYDGIKIERSQNKCETDLRKKFSISKDKVLIGNIANHARAKDLVTFVKTVNYLVNEMKIKNVHFVQIGKEGKHSPDFLPLIDAYNLQDYITIAGFLENAMDAISQLDVYLMTSEREGLPITVYEAFLEKIPVISTKAGGIPEAIKHNENGLLSEIKDFKHLAKNISYLINEEEKQKDFAAKSYNLLLEKFTTKQLAVNTLKIYKETFK